MGVTWPETLKALPVQKCLYLVWERQRDEEKVQRLTRGETGAKVPAPLREGGGEKSKGHLSTDNGTIVSVSLEPGPDGQGGWNHKGPYPRFFGSRFGRVGIVW